MQIRPLRADEGELLRRVRLRSLADSPGSFSTELADEQALPESDWAARAAAPDQVVFVALASDGEPVGIAGARWHRESRDTVGLWGMWVAPAQRGSGLGARLVDAAREWAALQGATRLRLGVMADVPAAIAFYERLGFERVGGERPLTRDPSRHWHEMLRPLTPAR